MNPAEIDCATACVNGCILGDQCPNREYQAQASQFIQEKSLDEMIALAEEAARKRAMEPPKWVFPEDGI